MTPTGGAQARLFEIDQPVRSIPTPPNGIGRPGGGVGPSLTRDTTAGSLGVLVSKLGHTQETVERVRLALRITALAERLVGESIDQARAAGISWRSLGASLDLPHQTLFRRYGSRHDVENANLE